MERMRILEHVVYNGLFLKANNFIALDNAIFNIL